MKIRNYRAEDAIFLAHLYRRSVTVLGRRDYSLRQVAVWASRRAEPAHFHRLIADGRTRLVAVDDQDRPMAFVDLEKDGHLDLLYCSPDMAGKGVASALYEALEKIARERSVTRIYCEASEAARRFFLKKGFTVTALRQFEISGIALHNYAMEKALANDPAEPPVPSR
jgi:putative acetyltransferase